MKLDAEGLAVIIAEELARQNGEDYIDNLGDGESIIIMGALPVINLVELSEKILEAFRDGDN